MDKEVDLLVPDPYSLGHFNIHGLTLLHAALSELSALRRAVD